MCAIFAGRGKKESVLPPREKADLPCSRLPWRPAMTEWPEGRERTRPLGALQGDLCALRAVLWTLTFPQSEMGSKGVT